MKCPICKDVKLLMTEKQGIEIDYCPECRGIWLDRGELEKLIEKSNNYQEQKSSYDEENSSHHKKEEYSNQNKRRKESFISNIFDMFGGD